MQCPKNLEKDSLILYFKEFAGRSLTERDEYLFTYFPLAFYKSLRKTENIRISFLDVC